MLSTAHIRTERPLGAWNRNNASIASAKVRNSHPNPHAYCTLCTPPRFARTLLWHTTFTRCFFSCLHALHLWPQRAPRPPVRAATILLVALVACALTAVPISAADGACGRQRRDANKPFVLFAAMPLVGHLMPLVFQAQELTSRNATRRVVVATNRFVGSPHKELQLMLNADDRARGEMEVEFVEVGFMNETSKSIVRADVFADTTLTVRTRAHALQLVQCPPS